MTWSKSPSALVAAVGPAVGREVVEADPVVGQAGGDEALAAAAHRLHHRRPDLAGEQRHERSRRRRRGPASRHSASNRSQNSSKVTSLRSKRAQALASGFVELTVRMKSRGSPVRVLEAVEGLEGAREDHPAEVEEGGTDRHGGHRRVTVRTVMSDQQQGRGGGWPPMASGTRRSRLRPCRRGDLGHATGRSSAALGACPRGAIAALVIAGVLGLVVLIGGAVLLARDRRQRRVEQQRHHRVRRRGPDATEPDPSDLPEGFVLIEGDERGDRRARVLGRCVNPEDAALTAEQFAELFPDLDAGDDRADGRRARAGRRAGGLRHRSGEFESNINILAVPGEAPLAVLEDEVPGQLAALGAEGSSPSHRRHRGRRGPAGSSTRST